MLHIFLLFSQIRLCRTASFVRTGNASTTDFPGWAINYRADGFKPVCGQSLEEPGGGAFSNCGECEAARVAFRSNNSMSVEVYDMSGARSYSTMAAGEQLCLCYTLLRSTDNVPLDICMLFGAFAEVSVKDGIAVGSHEANAGKVALPLCEQNEKMDVTTTSRNTSKVADAATTSTTHPATSNTSTGSITSTTNAINGSLTSSAGTGPTNVVDSRADGGPHGLSIEAKIALGSILVGVPGAVVAVVSIIRLLRGRTRQGPVIT